MANIPAGVIIGWPASLSPGPGAGWVREPLLDDRHLCGSLIPGGLGNTYSYFETHRHTTTHGTTYESSNPHGVSSHIHTGTVSSSNGSRAASPGSTSFAPAVSHNHIVNCASQGGYLSGSSNTYSNTVLSQSGYPIVRVVWMKSDGSPSVIPAGALILYDLGVLPTGFALYPDAYDRLLQGAITGDGGGLLEGDISWTHAHQNTHRHTWGLHDHLYSHLASKTVGTTVSAIISDRTAASYATLQPHAHEVYFQNANGQPTTYSISYLNSVTVAPRYRKLVLLQAMSNTPPPAGMVGAFLGLSPSIPANWSLCDGTNGTYDLTDRFVRVCTGLSGVGTTGGGGSAFGWPDTHSHSTSGHYHTSSHNHAFWYCNGPLAFAKVYGSGRVVLNGDHLHTASLASASPLISTIVLDVDRDWNEPDMFLAGNLNPKHRRVLFIRYVPHPSIISRLDSKTDICEVAYSTTDACYATGKLSTTPKLSDLVSLPIGYSCMAVNGIAILPDGTRVLYVTDATGIIKLTSKDLGKTWS